MMKKVLITLLISTALLSTILLIYFNTSKLQVKLNTANAYLVENDTYLDGNISDESLKKKVIENPQDYYAVIVNASIMNTKNIGYNRWKFYTQNTYDDKKIFLPLDEPESFSSSIVYPNSSLDNIGFTIVVYYENGTKEKVEDFLLGELEIYAVGHPILVKNESDSQEKNTDVGFVS